MTDREALAALLLECVIDLPALSGIGSSPELLHAARLADADRLIAAGVHLGDEGLDAAWERAEAALPEGWKGPWVGPHFEGGYWASVDRDGKSMDEEILSTIDARGDTPAAALNALAARLSREEAEPR